MAGRNARETSLRSALSLFLFLEVVPILAEAESESDSEGIQRVSVLGKRDPGMIEAATKAVGEARKRLAAPECQQVFSDFTDGSGRTLAQNLEAAGRTAQIHLGWLIFRNGADKSLCLRSGVLAGTNPGERIVYLCAQFQNTARTDPGYAAALIIHEELHSLGLSENPPSSAEITDRVVRRCGR